MKLAMPSETRPGETRVALTPETVGRLVKGDLEVAVQAGAGQSAFHSDEAYRQAGATVVDNPAALADADVVLSIWPPSAESPVPAAGQVLVSMLTPLTDHETVRRLAGANVASFALDMVPRITRAQSMDVLSSMATIAGYRAVIAAAARMAKMTPMMMTAAGTIRPANAMVIGAGVAGLQAIATAKRLGAVVTAVDVRPAVREQIESLGAKFVPMEVDHSAQDAGGYATDLGEDFYKGEQDILAPYIKNSDLVVSTAQIPGKPAPKLITETMLGSMKPGSVIVDLAAGTGGNTTVTAADQEVVHEDILVLAPTNLPAQVPVHASEMFSKNIESFLKEIIREGQLNFDLDNEVITGTLITRNGEVVHERTAAAMEQAS